MNDAPKRKKVVDKNTVTITAHDYEGFKPGRCLKCGLDHLHPTHHKGKLRPDGWPEARAQWKAEQVRKDVEEKRLAAVQEEKAAPFGKKGEGK